MLDPSLAGAFIDGGIRHRLLGVPVLRFSLWHLLLLQALDSPFLRHGEVGPFELRTAVGVCRLRFGRFRVRRTWLGPLTLVRLDIVLNQPRIGAKLDFVTGPPVADVATAQISTSYLRDYVNLHNGRARLRATTKYQPLADEPIEATFGTLLNGDDPQFALGTAQAVINGIECSERHVERSACVPAQCRRRAREVLDDLAS